MQPPPCCQATVTVPSAATTAAGRLASAMVKSRGAPKSAAPAASPGPDVIFATRRAWESRDDQAVRVAGDQDEVAAR
jgi:hypothetical protein